MHTIIYKSGDLTKASEPLIMHGCNARGVMGSGVAKALRDKWPEIFIAYKVLCNQHDGYPQAILGKVVPCPVGPRTLVLNAITQSSYGAVQQQLRDPIKYVSYDAIDKATKHIAKNYHGPIAMPKIGCGLGGGDWSIVEAIIKANLTPTMQVVVYEGP